MSAVLMDSPVAQLRTAPQSMPAEQSVLGGLMLAPHRLDDVVEVLSEDDFFRHDHRLIYRAICEQGEKNRPFDAVTLGEWFESQGKAQEVDGGAYLIELSSTTPSAANIMAYAEIVREKSLQRKLIDIGTGAVNDGFTNVPVRDAVETLTQNLVELEPKQRGGLQPAGTALAKFHADLEARFNRGNKLSGMPTPWSELNDATHGLQAGELIMIAARPSMGKSIMGLNLALFAAMRDLRTAFFSLEMSEVQCVRRCAASLKNIPHDWLLSPSKGDEDYWPKLTSALRDIKAAPLLIDDTPSITAQQFVARARRAHRQKPLDLIVVDHIHDFKIDAKLARYQYGEIAQAGKNLAKQWGIPVVMLGQLNRNVTGRTERRPTLADLRESGELEQKGDLILFLHREDYYDTPTQKSHLQGVVECHIAKGRDIEAGKRITLKNSYHQMRLDDWEGPMPQPPALDRPIRGMGRAAPQRDF